MCSRVFESSAVRACVCALVRGCARMLVPFSLQAMPYSGHAFLQAMASPDHAFCRQHLRRATPFAGAAFFRHAFFRQCSFQATPFASDGFF
eukprot:10350265-Alexandrium_andersonii.AAC.1